VARSDVPLDTVTARGVGHDETHACRVGRLEDCNAGLTASVDVVWTLASGAKAIEPLRGGAGAGRLTHPAASRPSASVASHRLAAATACFRFQTAPQRLVAVVWVATGSRDDGGRCHRQRDWRRCIRGRPHGGRVRCGVASGGADACPVTPARRHQRVAIYAALFIRVRVPRALSPPLASLGRRRWHRRQPIHR